MSGFNRTTIVRGPAQVQFGTSNTITFISKGDIKIVWSFDPFPIETSPFGLVDERISNRKAEVSFTPVGDWGSLSLTQVGMIFPLNNKTIAQKIGQSLFGSSDNTLIITGADGSQITFANAAVTKSPDLMLSAVKTMFGEMTFTCIGAISTAWTDADSFSTLGSGSFSASLTTANIYTQPYQFKWPSGGSAPWADMETTEGAIVSFEHQYDPVVVDEIGIVDYTIGKWGVKVRMQPVNVTMAQVEALFDAAIQGAAAARGSSIVAAMSNNMTIVNRGTVNVDIVLNKMIMKRPEVQYGMTAIRTPQLEWETTVHAASDVPYNIALT